MNLKPKKIVISWFTSAFLTLLLIQPMLSYADEDNKQWHQGGTLHEATVSDWRVASPENKLATVSDWLSATLWKGQLTSYSAFEKLKEKSEMLVAAVDGVAESEEIGSIKIIEIAASILTMSNDLGPD